jgi:hypothetical protein
VLESAQQVIAYMPQGRPHRLPWRHIPLGQALHRFELRRPDGSQLTLLLKHFRARDSASLSR